MKITGYSFGQMEVDGKSYRSDIIILPNRVVDGWWRQEGHSLVPEDLVDVVAVGPKVLVIGIGNSGRMNIPPTTISYLENKGIEVRSAPTGNAVELFDNIRREFRAVVGAFHLTC
jgi:hypothetical protein